MVSTRWRRRRHSERKALDMTATIWHAVLSDEKGLYNSCSQIGPTARPLLVAERVWHTVGPISFVGHGWQKLGVATRSMKITRRISTAMTGSSSARSFSSLLGSGDAVSCVVQRSVLRFTTCTMDASVVKECPTLPVCATNAMRSFTTRHRGENANGRNPRRRGRLKNKTRGVSESSLYGVAIWIDQAAR